MPGDFGVFEGISIAHSFCSFDVHEFVLGAVEALKWMSIQTSLSAAHRRYTLNKTNHGLFAIRVEAAVVAGVDISLEKSVLIFDWVGGEGWFGVVSEVSNESLTIIQLNLQRLIINCSPFSSY